MKIGRSHVGTLVLTLSSLTATVFLLIWILNNRMTRFSFRPAMFVCRNPTDYPRVALLNRHRGTAHDFSIVAKHLNFSYTEYPPEQFSPYGQSDADADFLNTNLGFGDHLCKCYDYVFVIDTIPDGRYILH
jgi:hypothetical protein